MSLTITGIFFFLLKKYIFQNIAVKKKKLIKKLKYLHYIDFVINLEKSNS